jgi:hypothetical protein
MRTIVIAVTIGAVALLGCGGGTSTVTDGTRSTYGVFLLVGDAERCDLVTHVIPEAGAPRSAFQALRALLAGPDGDEDDVGTATMFTAATAGMVRSVTVEDGTAFVDFEDFRQIIPNASASCGSQALLAQLDATVEQFPGTERAVYSFNGDRAAFYEWLQREPPEA